MALRIPANLIFLCVFMLFCSGTALGAEALIDINIAQTREFRGKVSKAMATEAALSASRAAALDVAVRLLANVEELRLLLGSEVMSLAPRPDPRALALALLNETEHPVSISGVPPNMQVEARVTLRLDDTREARRSMAALLSRPLWLDYYAKAAEMELVSLKEYDTVSSSFLKETRKRPSQSNLQEDAPPEVLKLNQAAEKLFSTRAYISLLPELRGLAEDTKKQAMAKDPVRLSLLAEQLRAIGKACPDNFLLLAEQGFVQLLQGNFREAYELLDTALSLSPDFAPARDLRGVTLISLEFPSLALDDFNRAIELEPYHPSFYESRAIALFILEQHSPMCADLRQACNLGSCAGLEWASRQTLCR